MQDLLQMERTEASRSYLNFIMQAQDYCPDIHERMASVFNKEQDIWETVLLSAQKQAAYRHRLLQQDLPLFLRRHVLPDLNEKRDQSV